MVQFPEDAGPMAHPVRPDSYAAIDNFYTSTVYEKGAEVVRMMHTLVGREGFRQGMALYFQRHDGQAVTCDDFAQAIADANPGSGLSTRLEAFKRWYAQAGTPRLQARTAWDAAAGTLTLTLTQHCGATPGQPEKHPFVVPVRMGLVARDGRALPLTLSGAEGSADEQLLVLEHAEQSWTFTGLTGLDAAPVPSLLRGFSAPVVLDDGLGDGALRVLLSHDADAFNRWEAAQRLLMSQVRRALAARAAAASAEEPANVLDAALVQSLRQALQDPALDPAFKELVLNMPSERELFDQIDGADPEQVNAVREALLDQLARELHEDWAWAWDAHQVREGYAPTGEQSGRRALANLALAMLVRQAVRSGDTVWPGRAYQRFKDAGNMTDRLGALQALVNVHAELAAPALERMHSLFARDPLVIDKWFTLQARAPEQQGRVFARVRQLLQHPDFSLRNPNRARALLFAWHTNPAAFHRADAAGYVLWADKVVEIDAFNPQLAARFARALDRWTALPEPYRSAAREAIARVAGKAELSADTREIVMRSLASG
jgi:aminopeptidase N